MTTTLPLSIGRIFPPISKIRKLIVYVLMLNGGLMIAQSKISTLPVSQLQEAAQNLESNRPMDQVQSTNTDENMSQYYRLSNGRAAAITDTIQWNLAKASALSILSINNASSALAAAQYFDQPGDIEISGMDFYAFKTDTDGGSTIDVDIELYLASSDSLPTGAALASTSVTLGQFPPDAMSLADLRARAVFDTPVVVSAPYVMVLRNDSANAISLYGSDYQAAPPDGGQEWLCSLQIGTDWLRSYDINVGGVPFDADFFFEPYVAFDLTADFSLTPESNPGNNMVDVASNSSTDPFLENRMYNFNAAIGSSSDSYEFDFNDGSAVVNATSTSHTFPNSDPQSITLTITLESWYATYTDAVSKDWSQVLNIEEVDLGKLTLAPNPSTDRFEIKNINASLVESVQIFDLLGSNILETKSPNIETSTWNSGVYLVRINTSIGTVTKKYIKQ